MGLKAHFLSVFLFPLCRVVKIKVYSLLFWFLLVFVNTAFAQSSLTNIKSIAAHPQWIKLLHYKQPSVLDSYISSSDFFLSDSGRQSPLSELKATISALKLPSGAKPAQHAQCRFPARLLFLQQHLGDDFNNSLHPVICSHYQKWQTDAQISSISVIFASGYISNPASMYGHLFIKLNRSQNNSELLNYSLNYGAIVPDLENPVAYILKGILGGYDAAYSDKQFYLHQHNYGEVELRDMWEYQLALTQDDINLLSAHIWELLQVRFDYYFIDENCAYHIAKLLELVLSEPIIADNSLWVIPSTVASGIASNKYLDDNLLSSVTFIPSRESTLNQYYDFLTNEQQAVASLLIKSEYDFPQADAYQSLAVKQQTQIVEVLFQYQSVIEKKFPDSKFTVENKRKLIRERLSQPMGKSLDTPLLSSKTPPHMAMPESRFSMGTLHNNEQNWFLTTGFRLNYFDDLSTNLSQTRFSNLEMLDIELISNDQKTKVLRVDLIDIDSIYTEEIDWTKRNSLAWSVRVGYEQLQNDCFDCGIYFAEGELGKSYLYDNTIVYGMVGGKTFVGKKDDLAVSAKVGLITEISQDVKLKIEVKKLRGVIHGQSYDTLLNTELNYNFASHWEVRLFAQKAESSTIGLKVHYYWGY